MEYTIIIKSKLKKTQVFDIGSVLESRCISVEGFVDGRNTNDDYFSVIRWHRDDVIEALTQRGIPLNETNIDLVIADCGNSLEEKSIQDGWESLDFTITSLGLHDQSNIEEEGDNE